MPSEIWGPGPFDNAIAQTFAFKLKTERTGKTLPLLVQRFEKPVSSAVDALEVIALAEFWNLVAGHSPHASGCPLLTEWVVAKKIKPLGDGALDGAPARLRDIAADAKIAKLFGKMAPDWRSEVEQTAKRIEAGKKPRPVKPDAMAIKTLKTLAADRADRDPDSLYPMARGSKDVHLNFSHCGAPMAIAMARYPSVVSLRLNLCKKSDEAANLIPFRVLLQRWCDRLTRFECDVAPKSWNSRFLDNYLAELSQMARLEVFESVRFDVTDDVIEAIAHAPTLREIRISCEGNGPTAKALDMLNDRKALQILWLRGARITPKEAAAYAKAHPKMYVDINTF